jgi:hypothetical protein
MPRQLVPSDGACRGLQPRAAVVHAKRQNLHERITGLRRGDNVPFDSTSRLDLEAQLGRASPRVRLLPRVKRRNADTHPATHPRSQTCIHSISDWTPHRPLQAGRRTHHR